MPLAYWTRNDRDIQYYDYLLGRYNSVDLNMLFLIGYSAATGHSHVSDHIWIPNSIIDKDGEERITDLSFFNKAHEYLDDKWRIDLTDDGLYFDIWAFRYLLEELGFVSGVNGKIPEFMSSSDYTPISIQEALQFIPPQRRDGESDIDYSERYDQAYTSWNALRRRVSYPLRYQLSEGYLYGLMEMGYGSAPFARDDIGWYKGTDSGITQAAMDVFHNPVYRGREDLQGKNLFYNAENPNPYDLTDTVGALSQSSGDLSEPIDDHSSTLTGDLYGEIDLPSLPDMYRYADIYVGLGVEVQMTFWMVAGTMIPNVFISTKVEASNNAFYAGDFNIRANMDIKRLPLTVEDISIRNRIKVPVRIGAEFSTQYTLPDVYLNADCGTYDLEHVSQQIDQGVENGAYVVAEQVMDLNSDELMEHDSSSTASMAVSYRSGLTFKEMGITSPGQDAMYGLSASGIKDILYVHVIPDASFTHEQIERLTEDQINLLHKSSVVGNIIDVTNEYDSDRPNLVVRVSFDMTEQTGVFNISSLVLYASRMDNNAVIPFAVVSVGDEQVVSVDTRLMRELMLTLRLNNI